MMRLITNRRINPSGILVGSFFFVIILGAFILYLPFMQADVKISFLDCLFTSTSAVCVTGLTSVDTSVSWSNFGKAVIVVLIQTGGLGIMTFSIAMVFLTGKRPSIRAHLVFKGTLGSVPGSEVGRLACNVILYTIIIESVGAILLFLRFWRDFNAWDALGIALFHSISAFCNAGFSTFKSNLFDYMLDSTVNLVIMGLIVLGGLGFIVLGEIRQWVWSFLNRRRFRLSLHTKVVLVTTVMLILFSILLIWLLEYIGNNSQVWQGSLWPFLFCSITPRTAGFNTIPMSELCNSTLLIIIILMFIGASSGSTGGGVKTTTFAVLLAFLWTRLKGQSRVTLGYRAIPISQVEDSQTLILASFLMLGISILILVSFNDNFINRERGDILVYIFEAVSAFGTVGLSMGITFDLNPFAKMILIFLMFLGRLGPLTFIYISSTRFIPARYQLAEEKLMLG